MEKYQPDRNNIVNVAAKIKDIQTDVLLGSIVVLDIIDNYLVTTDIQSTDWAIHLFDKNKLTYVTSAGIIGNGPSEITRIGQISVDNNNKILWLPDLGKQVMWMFPLDSILENKSYKPSRKVTFHKEFLFTNSFGVLNDSIAMGKAVSLIGNNDYELIVAKLNLNNNKAKKFGYVHPRAVGKRSESYCKVSVNNGIYVDCFNRCDLMTICDLNGDLKCNVYGGADWFNKSKKNSYFEKVDFFNGNILASYNGEVFVIYDEYQRPKVNAPSKILVFDLEGEYKMTLETGFKFSNFCIDEENQRVFAYFENRENPLGYFSITQLN